jgi:hypothetical protein
MGCDDKPINEKTSPAQGSERSRRQATELMFEDIFSRGASDEQMAALREAAERHKAAQAALMEAAGVLWNSKVDAAMTIGGPHGASLAMSQRLNFFDNCACSPCKIVVACW